MAHDEDFNRLALVSDKKEANTVVKDLTLADIMRSKCNDVLRYAFLPLQSKQIIILALILQCL